MPRPVEAPQDIEPWKQALGALLGDSETYWRESELSRQAALRFVGGLRASQFEDMLRQTKTPHPLRLPDLSPAKRALLARRLHERSSK